LPSPFTRTQNKRTHTPARPHQFSQKNGELRNLEQSEVNKKGRLKSYLFQHLLFSHLVQITECTHAVKKYQKYLRSSALKIFATMNAQKNRNIASEIRMH
jgi:hypothetical protein